MLIFEYIARNRNLNFGQVFFSGKHNITQSESFKIKITTTQDQNNKKNPADSNTKNVEIAVSLKYLNNFSRTLEMPLNDCEISLNLTWSEIYISSSATWKTKFPIADTKPYVPVVTLSIEDDINYWSS